MNWLNNRYSVTLVSFSLVSLFLITGVVLAGEEPKYETGKSIEAQLRAAVDAGKITQEQADAKRKAIADGKVWKSKGLRNKTGKSMEAQLRAEVDAGKITQEQADAKRKAIADGKVWKSKGHLSY